MVSYDIINFRSEYTTTISHIPQAELQMPSIVFCPSYLSTTHWWEFERYAADWTSITERCEREQSLPNVNYDSNFPGHDAAEHIFIQSMFPIDEFFAYCAFNWLQIQCSEMIEFVTIPGGVCYKIRDLSDFKMIEPCHERLRSSEISF